MREVKVRIWIESKHHFRYGKITVGEEWLDIVDKEKYLVQFEGKSSEYWLGKHIEIIGAVKTKEVIKEKVNERTPINMGGQRDFLNRRF